MKKNILILFVLLTTIVITIVSCKKDDDEETNIFESEISIIMDNAISQTGVAGAAVYSVNKEGDIAWLANGLMNTSSNTPMQRDTKFRIASISKTFLATVVLQLMEQGDVSLDQSYSNYLPDSVVNLFPYDGQATIMQLLNHTSGIYDFEDDQFEEILFSDLLKQWTPWELLNYTSTADSAVFYPPGTKYGYSNTNYILLGLIVETVTNKSMEQNIRDGVITPLNLANTFSWEEGIPENNYATGYMPLPDGSFMVVDDQTVPLYFEWGHGQMISTVKDLFTYYNALLQGNLFTNISTLELMETGSPLSENSSSGLGLHLYHNEFGMGHSGSTAGFISVATINPQTGTTLILCFNQYNDDVMSLVAGGFLDLVFNEEK